MVEEVTRDTFARQLNTPFRVAGYPASVATLELVEASERRALASHEIFSLVFRGPPDVVLPQATYRFEHHAIGAFDLFIVPIRQDSRGLYYEAVFNRLRQTNEG